MLLSKKNQEKLTLAVVIVALVALLPQFVWAVKCMVKDEWGAMHLTFKHQPLYPVSVIIVSVAVIVVGIILLLRIFKIRK